MRGWRSATACLWLCGAVMAGFAPLGRAESVRLEIQRRESVLGGREFGVAGAYEKLSGWADFSFDPANEYNARIVDLPGAPRDAAGRVSARANFMVLKPLRAEGGSGTAIVEISNRGGKALLAYFNAALGSLDPASEAEFGDGLLLRQGHTLIWVGWQFDVPDDAGLLRLQTPTARDGSASITGLVRSDWTVDAPTRVLPLGHRNHTPYAVADVRDPANVLTERDGGEALKRIVPRERWQFVSADGAAPSVPTHIRMLEGFRGGKIYELVYRARDPVVVGLGLAVVRELASYVKYDTRCPFAARWVLAFGVSQSGRFLRHFIYQGFNTDAQGRKVFDGMFVHTAGAGRGSFNHRFAQPSRDGHRYSAFWYPTDLFPFSGAGQRDDVSGASDGLYERQHQWAHLPRIFYTNTGYEYWGRAAALIHVTPDGVRDAPVLASERIYHLASGQHFVVGLEALQPQPGEPGTYRGNPLDFLVNLRALLPRLVDWIKHDKTPPASRYPRIARGELIAPDKLRAALPAAVARTRFSHTAARLDFGARWEQGIIDHEPPKLGKSFSALVPQVDEFGNEGGGVRNVAVRVPLASYLPWNLRAGLTNPSELTDFYGSLVPLARDDAERQRRADPRPSLQALYPDKRTYLAKVEAEARQLIEEGFLLAEDAKRVSAQADQLWDWVMAR